MPHTAGPTVVGVDRRRAVLRAAMVVAQQRGYHGTTLARVAEAAGVEPAVVEAEFTDRSELLRAALELAWEDWFEEVPTWREVEPLPDLHAEIDRRLRAGVTAGQRAADFWRLGLLLRLEPALADSDGWELFADVRRRTRVALRAYWARILPADTADDEGLLDLMVQGHLSLVDGSILATHGSPDWDLDQLMSLVATGIAAVLREGSIYRRGRP